MKRFGPAAALATATRHRILVRGDDTAIPATAEEGVALWQLDPRGVGAGRWTRRNPPNHVERSMALLGDTVAGGQVRDTLAALAVIRAADPDGSSPRPIDVAGTGAAGLVAAYAAIFSPLVATVALDHPPSTHMAPDAPAFLNILRVADAPTLLGLIAPRLSMLAQMGQLGGFKTQAGRLAGIGLVSPRISPLVALVRKPPVTRQARLLYGLSILSPRAAVLVGMLQSFSKMAAVVR